ncbi:MAG: DCC1-like thiol-disulfide oxidoreductase family protein [Dysgonamonadaceae bacterium]|nr:DCC1-like thiol-disulfide oxidoreductase family protein [Dysgonamonadaceae bacterium]MDD4728034.1 DCC1-like thiol-disulfide oxidoreductase family protein [Dysgonamonadaceae bacterium]
MKSIVFYDDLCGVCNYWVNWILKYDKEEVFYFAPLQSDFADIFSAHFKYKFPLETLVVWEVNEAFLIKSDAVIFILQLIKPSSLGAKVLKFFPKDLRDAGYSVFAYFRRYVPMKSCKIPSKKDRVRFLTQFSVSETLNKLKL